MVRHSLEGDFKAAKTINDGLIAAYDLMFGENNPAGVKGAMAEMRLIGNYLRLPVVPLSEGFQARWAAYLRKK
jgi:4-hydroxy-tetrahydrodipicolinate synthase